MRSCDFMSAAHELIKEAERAARDAETWAEISNFLFNPADGLVAKAYPTRAARAAFVQTVEYRKIRQLISDARQHHGLVQGANPRGKDMTTTAQIVHSDPDILGGTPVFVGTRVPVQSLLDYLEAGDSLDEFLDHFPSVSREQAVATLELAKSLLMAHAHSP
jgi:uncharacterized protein (DUF433 family)